jgi:hypothetical protein
MISSAVVIDWDHQECLRNYAASGDSVDENCRSDIDDSLSCRTDQTTVQASNVRRVTVSR